MTALLARDPRSLRTWAGERTDLSDRCPSGHDLALATVAVRAGWDDADIVALLVAHRRQHGSPLKLRGDYYARTLARAHAARATRPSGSAQAKVG